jgi:hypothetical protein
VGFALNAVWSLILNVRHVLTWPQTIGFGIAGFALVSSAILFLRQRSSGVEAEAVLSAPKPRTGSISAGTTIDAGSDVRARGDIEAGESVRADGDIEAGTQQGVGETEARRLLSVGLSLRGELAVTPWGAKELGGISAVSFLPGKVTEFAACVRALFYGHHLEKISMSEDEERDLLVKPVALDSLRKIVDSHIEALKVFLGPKRSTRTITRPDAQARRREVLERFADRGEEIRAATLKVAYPSSSSLWAPAAQWEVQKVLLIKWLSELHDYDEMPEAFRNSIPWPEGSLMAKGGLSMIDTTLDLLDEATKQLEDTDAGGSAE